MVRRLDCRWFVAAANWRRDGEGLCPWRFVGDDGSVLRRRIDRRHRPALRRRREPRAIAARRVRVDDRSLRVVLEQLVQAARLALQAGLAQRHAAWRCDVEGILIWHRVVARRRGESRAGAATQGVWRSLEWEALRLVLGLR